MFQYASNQKCKLLQYIPFMYQKSKWYKEVKVPRNRKKCGNEYSLPESTRV